MRQICELHRKLCHLILGICELATVIGIAIVPTADAQPSASVGAWAMLFQATESLTASVSRHELTLVHSQDSVISAAISSLLADPGGPDSATFDRRAALTAFAQAVSGLHSAADDNRQSECDERIRDLTSQFERLQKYSDPATLKAARDYADRFTCPMHPEIVGRRDVLCPKCGMQLDQRIVLQPVNMPDGQRRQVLKAWVDLDHLLEVGRPVHAILHLRHELGEPVTPAELIETHTKKIHLLIIDQSLTDYHHEHPQPTDAPGDYTFTFVPGKPGPYRAWADVRPQPLGLQEYDIMELASNSRGEAIQRQRETLTAEVAGLRYELKFDASQLKVATPVTASLRVTRKDGSAFANLEPVMATFAHLVGFNEDGASVMHIHPKGPPITDERARGGPQLDFVFYATKPGFTRLFAQVQIDGRPVYVPLVIKVEP